jgi:TPR repeat protein
MWPRGGGGALLRALQETLGRCVKRRRAGGGKLARGARHLDVSENFSAVCELSRWFELRRLVVVASSALSQAPHGWRVAHRFTRIDMSAPDNRLETESEGVVYFENLENYGVERWCGAELSEAEREVLEEAATMGDVCLQYGLGVKLLKCGCDSCVPAAIEAFELAAVERFADDARAVQFALKNTTKELVISYGASVYISSMAMNALANLYGEAHEPSLRAHWLEMSIPCLEKVLELHNPRSQMRLRSKKPVKRMLTQAIKHIMQYYRVRDIPTAMMYARKGANLNNAKCQFELGFHHLHGHGVSIDIGEAKSWILKAFERGYAAALEALMLISYYYKDTRDDVTVVSLIQNARDEPDRFLKAENIRDCVRVMHSRAHLHGLGTQAKDTKKGIKLLRKPITGASACELAMCHFAGNGVPRNRNKAEKYIDRCFAVLRREVPEFRDDKAWTRITVTRIPLRCMTLFNVATYMQQRLNLTSECEKAQVSIFGLLKSPLQEHDGIPETERALHWIGLRDILRCEECRRDDALFRCGGCLVARYCSVECQLRGWREGKHKEECPMNFPCVRCVRKEKNLVHPTDCACEARAARRRLRRRQNAAATTGDVDASPAA